MTILTFPLYYTLFAFFQVLGFHLVGHRIKLLPVTYFHKRKKIFHIESKFHLNNNKALVKDTTRALPFERWKNTCRRREQITDSFSSRILMAIFVLKRKRMITFWCPRLMEKLLLNAETNETVCLIQINNQWPIAKRMFDDMQIERPNKPGYRKINARFIGKRRSLPKTYVVN